MLPSNVWSGAKITTIGEGNGSVSKGCFLKYKYFEVSTVSYGTGSAISFWKPWRCSTTTLVQLGCIPSEEALDNSNLFILRSR